VEVLEWIGDIEPFGMLQEVWVQMKGIPPRRCHWKTFAQIASGFGLMIEVDWSTLFKTFRRSVLERLMEMWFELLGIEEEVNLVEEEDQIVWSFCSNGKFSVQSLYAIINHRGVKPVFVQSVWKLKIPPKVQIFLWLLSKNKLLTRTNLAKRRKLEDLSCLFCSETETVHHLFFDCCVAKGVWSVLADILNLSGNCNYEYVASLWLANKKFMLANVVNAATL
jgi:hypothetical protein